MERGFRFRAAGLLFYVLVGLHLASSPGLGHWLSSAIQDGDLLAALTAAIAAGLLLFTSDAIGYLFSSMFVFAFNVLGGYATMYRHRLANNAYRDAILEEVSRPLPRGRYAIPPGPFNESLADLNHDQLLCFFLWHVEDVSGQLDDWVERRHTAYFTGWTAVLALALATLLPGLLAGSGLIAFSTVNWFIIAGTAILSAMLVFNAEKAMRDNFGVLDLAIARKLNPRVRAVYERLNPRNASRNTTRAA